MQSQPESHARVARAPDLALGRAKAMFFLAAGMSFVMSVTLFFGGDQTRGIFVGIWVPSILSAGALLTGGRQHD